jgi:hypothetical protein
MEHWMKTAEIKDAARVVRRRTSRDEVSEGLSESFDPTREADGGLQGDFVPDGSREMDTDFKGARE